MNNNHSGNNSNGECRTESDLSRGKQVASMATTAKLQMMVITAIMACALNPNSVLPCGVTSSNTHTHTHLHTHTHTYTHTHRDTHTHVHTPASWSGTSYEARNICLLFLYLFDCYQVEICSGSLRNRFETALKPPWNRFGIAGSGKDGKSSPWSLITEKPLWNRFGTTLKLLRNRFGTALEPLWNRFGTALEPLWNRWLRKRREIVTLVTLRTATSWMCLRILKDSRLVFRDFLNSRTRNNWR